MRSPYCMFETRSSLAEPIWYGSELMEPKSARGRPGGRMHAAELTGIGQPPMLRAQTGPLPFPLGMAASARFQTSVWTSVRRAPQSTVSR